MKQFRRKSLSCLCAKNTLPPTTNGNNLVPALEHRNQLINNSISKLPFAEARVKSISAKWTSFLLSQLSNVDDCHGHFFYKTISSFSPIIRTKNKQTSNDECEGGKSRRKSCEKDLFNIKIELEAVTKLDGYQGGCLWNER